MNAMIRQRANNESRCESSKYISEVTVLAWIRTMRCYDNSINKMCSYSPIKYEGKRTLKAITKFLRKYVGVTANDKMQRTKTSDGSGGAALPPASAPSLLVAKNDEL